MVSPILCGALTSFPLPGQPLRRGGLPRQRRRGGLTSAPPAASCASLPGKALVVPALRGFAGCATTFDAAGTSMLRGARLGRAPLSGRGLVPWRHGHARSKQSTRWPIPARAFVIRYPNGDFEYDFTRRAFPSVGERLRRKGLLWLVTRITQGRVVTVYVERSDQQHSEEQGDPA
jgi:hypothetical protein